MLKQGIKQNALSKKSGVNQPAISRLLNGSINIKVDNIFHVLNALGLLNTGDIKNDCPISCDQDLQDLCKKVKTIMDSKTGFSDALRANIHAFEESVKLKREVENLKEVMSLGRNAGTSLKPVRNIGRKKRAG